MGLKIIISSIFISLIILFFVVRFIIRKIKKVDPELEEAEKEFEEGKILLPVDKRDFEDLEDFKEKTKHIPKIKEKLDTLDKDFEEWEIDLEGIEGVKNVQQ